MQDFVRSSGWREADFDGVETKGVRPLAQAAQVRTNRATQHLFLSSIDGVKAGHQRARGPGLHFDEHEDLCIQTDQVDFFPAIMRIPPVPRDDRESAIPPQPRFGSTFSHDTDVSSTHQAL